MTPKLAHTAFSTKSLLYYFANTHSLAHASSNKSGYKSDFDLLIIVSAKYLCDFEYWEKAEERFLFHPNIRRTVQLVVEPLSHVNKMLSERQYFFSDIRDEGIALYEANSRKALPQAKPLNEAEFTALSQKHFEIAFPSAKEIFETAHLQIEKGMNKWAAFSLHQATEHAYNAFLLVHTHYSPSTHNIRKLRGFSEDLDKTLVTIWPRNNRIARRRFELLRRAYVEARYSEHYEISREDLDWLTDRVTHLHKAIEKVCKKRLNKC